MPIHPEQLTASVQRERRDIAVLHQLLIHNAYSLPGVINKLQKADELPVICQGVLDCRNSAVPKRDRISRPTTQLALQRSIRKLDSLYHHVLGLSLKLRFTPANFRESVRFRH